MSIELIGGASALAQAQFTGTTTEDPYALKAQQDQASATIDRQTFGAAVVTATLDNLNGQGSSALSAAPMDKQTFGAAVVAKTLDYMNTGPSLDAQMAQSYDFQKSVLSGPLEASGALLNLKT